MNQIKSFVRTISPALYIKKDEKVYHAVREVDFGREYELVLSAPLGSGVSGEVYRCISKETNKVLALKILPDTKKALNEVVLQRRCQHSEHVVPIVDVFRCAGHHPGCRTGGRYLYVVMELQREGNLFQFIKQQGGVREETAVPLVRQVVSGLQSMHKQGIIHKDLKPENILLSDREDQKQLCAKICDFGLSVEEKSNPTRVEYTPYYVAPEVLCKDRQYNYQLSVEDCKPYDHRCDIWALGVIIYSMLSGKTPFYSEVHGRSITPIMYDNILNARFKFQDDPWKNISANAKDLISSLLVADPSKRLTLEQVLKHPWLSESN